MDINKKEMYFSPEAEVFEVKTEGVICQSLVEDVDVLQDPNDYTPGGDPFAF